MFSELERVGGGERKKGGGKEESGENIGKTEVGIKYQVSTRLGQAELAHQARLAQLEARLNRISSIVASSSPLSVSTYVQFDTIVEISIKAVGKGVMIAPLFKIISLSSNPRNSLYNTLLDIKIFLIFPFKQALFSSHN